MPTYTFKNKKTEEIIELDMKIAEYDNFLKENPHLQRHYNSTFGIRADMTLEPPSDFQKYVLGRIKENVPGAKKGIERSMRHFKIPREW